MSTIRPFKEKFETNFDKMYELQKLVIDVAVFNFFLIFYGKFVNRPSEGA